MNVTTGKEPLATVRGFKGLWSRGAYETCPKDHLTDCQNCAFPGPEQVTIRESFSASSIIATRTIISYFIATVTGGACLLTLNSNGNFYDETHVVLLATIAGSPDDFTALNIYGRTYISFKKGGKALPGNQIYYFDGTNFLPAAGFPPVTWPTLAQVNPGVVDVGFHNVYVVFQTATGFLTKPSPVSAITSLGSRDIELSAIPTGPAGTVARVLLMTKANQLEPFFVPGGTINDNVTTTGIINVADSALIASASYLNDILSILPSCSSLRFYKGRMVIIGQDTAPDNIILSNQLSPETVNSVTNTINFPVDYGINTCNTGLIINDVLYIMKPNGTFSTQDNGGDPSIWGVSVIDSGIGCWDNGNTLFASSMSGSDVGGKSFVASQRGLMLFNGIYSSIPLTYKIEGLWRQLIPAYFYLVTVAHDAWLSRVYIAVPMQAGFGSGLCNTSSTGNVVTKMSGRPFFPGMKGMKITINSVAYTVATYVDETHVTTTTSPGNQIGVAYLNRYPGLANNGNGAALYAILMMDYSDGLDPMSVKWSFWESVLFDPLVGTPIRKMAVENFTLSYTTPPSPIYQLSFCNGGTTIFKLYPQGQASQIITVPSLSDETAAGSPVLPINQFITTAPLGGDNGVNMFSLINLSVYGIGILYLSVLTKNRGTQTFLRAFSLSNYNNQDLQRLINITSENIMVVLQCDNDLPSTLTGFIQPTEISVYGTKMWGMRAALTQSV